MQDSFMIFLWLGITIALAIIEMLTVQLTTIWFAAGAFVTMLLAICGVKNLAVQITVFAVVSLAALIVTRPLVKRFITSKTQPTNADMAIGKTAVVTECINTVDGKGSVKLGGTVWSARSADGSIIEAGNTVKVLRIEGVKLIVEKE